MGPDAFDIKSRSPEKTKKQEMGFKGIQRRGISPNLCPFVTAIMTQGGLGVQESIVTSKA